MTFAAVKAAQKFFQSAHGYIHVKSGYVHGRNLSTNSSVLPVDAPRVGFRPLPRPH